MVWDFPNIKWCYNLKYLHYFFFKKFFELLQMEIFVYFQYLGSTAMKEFKGTESTKRSIQKVVTSKDHAIEEINLSISYKGVKFVNPADKVDYFTYS